MNADAIRRGHGFLEGVDRIRLYYRRWEVPDPRATLLLIHGLSDHSGRYGPVAEVLAALSIDTFALDLRGHGLSEGRRGHVPRFEVFLEEVDRFRAEVHARRQRHLPTFILGHSMGGLILIRYLEEFAHSFDGVIVSSPWLDHGMPIPRWKTVLASVLDRVLPTAPFAARIPANRLSHNAAVVAAYRNDPLVHDRITPRLFMECSSAMRLARERRGRLRAPLLFLVAGSDELVDGRATLDFARSLSGGDVVIRFFPNHYHEVFNEVDRDPVSDALREWLMDRVA